MVGAPLSSCCTSLVVVVGGCCGWTFNVDGWHCHQQRRTRWQGQARVDPGSRGRATPQVTWPWPRVGRASTPNVWPDHLALSMDSVVRTGSYTLNGERILSVECTWGGSWWWQCCNNALHDLSHTCHPPKWVQECHGEKISHPSLFCSTLYLWPITGCHIRVHH